MARLLLTAAAALACAGLAGCNGAGGGAGTGGNNGICKPFAAANGMTTEPNAPTNGLPAAAPAGDPAAGLDDCLHRWGYALAASADPANIVGEAAVAACSQTLSGWNQGAVTGGGGAIQAPSLVSGQSTNPIAEHYAFAQGRALFYVVQARAGKCAPPPVSNGTPTGTRQ